MVAHTDGCFSAHEPPSLDMTEKNGRTNLDNVAHQEPDPSVGVTVQVALDQKVVNKGFYDIRTSFGELGSNKALDNPFSIDQYLMQGCG